MNQAMHFIQNHYLVSNANKGCELTLSFIVKWLTVPQQLCAKEGWKVRGVRVSLAYALNLPSARIKTIMKYHSLFVSHCYWNMLPNLGEKFGESLR